VIPEHTSEVLDALDPDLAARLRFVLEADSLKLVLRRNSITDGSRRENTGEHSWHLALMAIVLAPYSAEPVDLSRVVEMLLVHDLVEIDAGDTFLYDDAHAASKRERETRAADRLFGMLDEPVRGELRAAWEEFEAGATPSAQFARALDRVQPVLQNVYTDGASWRAHGITAPQVVAKNGPPIRAGAPELWPHVEAMLEEAIRRGALIR